MNKYSALILGIAILLVLLTGWLKTRAQLQLATPHQKAEKTAYYLKNFKTHSLTTTGQTQYQLTGASLAYQPTDNSIKILALKINLFKNQQTNWQITAGTAYGPKNLDPIHLQHNVKITQYPNNPQNPPMTITTENLLLNPSNKHAETLQTSYIIAGQTTITAHNGFTANLQTQRLTLNNVEAHYANNP